MVAKRYVTDDRRPVVGVVAQFDTPAALYHACERVRDAGFTKWDSFSPFPVHGMEEAMGIKRTILPLIVAMGGFTGAGLGYLMQWWMSKDYPLIVQGKPPTAWEQFVPITFELGILIASFTALIGMLALNGLPQWYNPLFRRVRFLRSSDDAFFVAIEAADPKFDPEACKTLLNGLGASAVEIVDD